MATVSDVVTWALKDAGVLAEGDTASSETFNDAYETLRQMLALWQVESIYVYAQQEVSFTPNGATTYTFGTAGTGGSTRFNKVDMVFWRDSSLDYPVTLMDTFQQYEEIGMKTQPGQPLYAFYLPSYTLGTLYLCPQPSTGSVRLVTSVDISTVTSQVATLNLPPEYVLPIRKCLAVELALAFRMKLDPALEKSAAGALRILKRANLRIQPLYMPDAILRTGRGNIFVG